MNKGKFAIAALFLAAAGISGCAPAFGAAGLFAIEQQNGGDGLI